MTPLHIACCKSNKNTVAVLLAHEFTEINLKDNFGVNAINKLFLQFKINFNKLRGRLCIFPFGKKILK